MASVYLAGGISGLTYEEAIGWRLEVAKLLIPSIAVLSPLRSKEYLASIAEKGDSDNSRIADHYDDFPLSTTKGIVTRDRNDIMRADAILVNLLESKKVSIGTVWEIGVADALRKPIVVIMEPSGNIHDHAMIRESAGYIATTVGDGAWLIKQILGTGVT